LLIGLLLAFLGFRLAVAGRGQGLKDLPPLIDWFPYRPGRGSADQCCADMSLFTQSMLMPRFFLTWAAATHCPTF